MSAYDEFNDLINQENNNTINRCDALFNRLHDLVNNGLYNFVKYKETNDISYLKKELEKVNKSSKENADPNIQKQPNQEKVDQLSNCALNVKIKKEKISSSSLDSFASTSSTILSEISTKKNNAKEMPAPSKIPPKKKKIKVEPVEPAETSMRSTRSKRTRSNMTLGIKEETIQPKTSDVIIQNTTVTVVDITDDKESDAEKEPGKSFDKGTNAAKQAESSSSRSTRTKTKKQKQIEEKEAAEKENTITKSVKTNQNKRSVSLRGNVSLNEQQTAKRSKSSSSSDLDQEHDKTADYEDAVSNIDVNENVETNNATMVINSTVVVENPKFTKKENREDNDAKAKKDWKTPPRTTRSKKKQIKEIFSPYEKTTTKKKIEAFEKLRSTPGTASKIPIISIGSDPGTSVKVKPYTPFSSKFAPKTCSTSRKMSGHNDSGLSLKSLSAMKASQAEYRERERRRKEKEAEAGLKKEAMLLAKAEEKKRKREEKQLKAQQQREILQKEKEKLLEIQKLKEEKYKQVIAEKEEKMQKNREEMEKKRLLAKNKAKLAKEKEGEEAAQNEVDAAELSRQAKKEQMRRAQQRAQEKSLPLYMVTKPPLLPTEDCYDSDDDEYQPKRNVKPEWCLKGLTQRLYTQLIAGEKIKNTLFCCTNYSPDLVDIFENVDPKILKRTSSAVWKKPPRYTFFSTTSDINFSEESNEENDV